MAEKKIAGETFRVQPLPAKRSLVLFARLGKVMGPGLPDLVSSFASRGDDSQSNSSAIKALSRILDTLEPQAFADLVEELVELAEIQQNGAYVDVNFDGHLSGRLNTAVEVVAFVLKEQFGDFFTGLLVNGRAAKKAG